MDNKLIRKEQCPDCAKNNKDTSKDNLAVYSDGQTHCFSCGKHGYVTHTTKKPIQIKEKDSQETEKEGDLESESESNERDESDEE